MPKPVDDLVKTLLDDPDFTPKRVKMTESLRLGQLLIHNIIKVRKEKRSLLI